MTFTVGDHVRLTPTTERKSPSIGTVVGFENESVQVEYRRRQGDKVTVTHKPESLEEMCKEHVYRPGFSRSSECGRRAKEDHLCGMHFSYRDKRRRERAAQEERLRLAEEYRAEMKLLEDALNQRIDELGLRHTAPSLKVVLPSKGNVMLTLDDLLRLIRNT